MPATSVAPANRRGTRRRFIGSLARNSLIGSMLDELTDAWNVDRMMTLCASRGKRATFLTNCEDVLPDRYVSMFEM